MPIVLSPEEVARLLEAAPAKYKAALSVAYSACLRVWEVVSLKVSDIDSKRMMFRVERGKGGRSSGDALATVAGPLARLVAHRAVATLVVSPARPDQPDVDAPAQSGLPRSGSHGRDYQGALSAARPNDKSA